MKKMLSITNHVEKANQNHNEISSHPINGYYKNGGEDVEKVKFS
jgi:hypothetical protein